MLSKAKKPLKKTVSFQHCTDNGDNEQGNNKSSSLASNINKLGFPSIKHPVSVIPYHLILLLFGLFHFGITRNPSDILLKSIPTLVLLESVYGYIIIQNTITPKKKSSNTSKVVSITKKQNTENNALLLTGSILASLLLSIPVFITVILFGAPLSSHVYETFLLSIHLSILIFYPLLVLYKMDTDKFSLIFQLDHIYRVIFSNQILLSSFFSLIGCWLGVLPIPLDWDRPWQQWPITLLTGAYIGSFSGGLISIAFATTNT